MGEFGPILLITLLFSTKRAPAEALILLAFIGVAVVTAVVAVRGVGHGWPLLERTIETSGQLAIRVAVVTIFALATLAASLGLDLLLGGFVAGVIVRLALRGREVAVFESKLTAVGYGFFIPFFFVVSGIKFNLTELTDDPDDLLKMLLLAFFSATQLPLVVAITTIAVERGHMRSGTAASLIAAGILSTMLYPFLGLRQRAYGTVASGP
jgi:Kef-type K+ transport system membrane component KefB